MHSCERRKQLLITPSNSRSLSWRDFERTGRNQWRVRADGYSDRGRTGAGAPARRTGVVRRSGGCCKQELTLSRTEGLAIVVTNDFLPDRAVRVPGLHLGLG